MAMALLVLLGLTLLKSFASPLPVVGRCSNTINLKDPNTNEDIISTTFCGPLKSSSALAQLPLIEPTNLHPDKTMYTVVMTGPSGINFLAVDCPLQGRLVDTQNCILLKAYSPPSQDGQYSVEIYSQKGSKIHTQPPGDSEMEMLLNQQDAVVHGPQASSIYVMQSHDTSLDHPRTALKSFADSGINHKIQKRTPDDEAPAAAPATTKKPTTTAAPSSGASGMSTSFLVLLFTVLIRLNIFESSML